MIMLRIKIPDMGCCKRLLGINVFWGPSWTTFKGPAAKISCTEKSGGHFSKWPPKWPLRAIFTYILVSETNRDMILVSTPMFPWSRNAVDVMLSHFIVSVLFKIQNGHQKSKMAAIFPPKWSYIELTLNISKIILQNHVEMIKIDIFKYYWLC